MDNIEFEKKYKERGINSQRRYPNEALIQFLAGRYFHLPKKDRKKIKCLELGCGSGANLWMIAKEGLAAYGLDNAPTGIALGKQVLRSWGVSAALKVGNMRELPWPDQFFDVIVDVVSMQHLDLAGHRESYQEVFRCLKPGGNFFQWHLGSHSFSFLHGGGHKVDKLTLDNINNLKAPLADSGQTCFLTKTAARQLLDQTGFCDINIETVDRTYHNGQQKIEYLAVSAVKPIK